MWARSYRTERWLTKRRPSHDFFLSVLRLEGAAVEEWACGILPTDLRLFTSYETSLHDCVCRMSLAVRMYTKEK